VGETLSQIGFGDSTDDGNDNWEGVALLCDSTETVDFKFLFRDGELSVSKGSGGTELVDSRV
jgi:hypothetical protein